MGETVGGAVDPGPMMAFQAFAATLRPQPVRDRQGRQIGVTAGSPDEIWLKHIGRMHGREKRTLVQWKGLIGHYRNQPAYR